MHGPDPRLLALLGLCSCVASSETPTAAPIEPSATGLIELPPEREPPTIVEALIRSGRESLAAGHYAAAHASLSLAIAEDPERAADLYMDALDAALGFGNVDAARTLILAIRPTTPEARQHLQSRIVRLHEIENDSGPGPCDAQIDGARRPLQRSADALTAWNELHARLPADQAIAIPIPPSEAEARQRLCDGHCTIGEPTFVKLVGNTEGTVGLVVAHELGFWVLPDLLHTNQSGCTDEVVLGFERHEGLVRVRAFADRLDDFDPADWAELAPTSGGYASYRSSGYPSSGYQAYAYASSGYQAYAYASSGYNYHYGCGGHYGGDYDYCEPSAHVERDLVLDLERGEIVLDIVRTGARGSALGRVNMAPSSEGPVIEVNACGQEHRLPLHYT